MLALGRLAGNDELRWDLTVSVIGRSRVGGHQGICAGCAQQSQRESGRHHWVPPLRFDFRSRRDRSTFATPVQQTPWDARIAAF
jgi:hypothetical protein